MDPLIHDMEHGHGPRRRVTPPDTTTGDLFATAKPTADQRRMAVYDCIAAHAEGITRPELASALGVPVEQIEPRISELLTRGRVKQIGKRDGHSVLSVTGAA